jgi:nucleoside-diphosphate-sugar epimerase
VTVLRIHGVFSQRRLGQFEEMIRRARNRQAVRVVRGAGGQYVHLEDVVAACCLVTGNRKAFGEVFNLAGSWQYQDTELARQIADMAETGAKVELVEDPGQRMVSVSAEKLRRVLGFSSMRGEFLSGLVRFREEEVRYARL